MMNRRLESGARVGAYTILEPLDEGGFGAVYRAARSGGGPVALKIFKDSEGALTAQRLVAQQNEIEALVRLRHPSLIELIDYGYAEEVGLFLVMELASGETLDKHLSRIGRMDTLEALLLARKIAEALSHCHAFGVLHLDLKPSNVVVVDAHEPRIKVLDFGLATISATWHAEHSQAAAGTVAYMAPESLLRSADRRPNARMDLYALGTVLYEALTGTLPFNVESMATLISQKLVGEFRPISELVPGTPQAVEALLRDLLCREPSRRSSNAAHVVGRLRDAYYETLRGSQSEAGGHTLSDGGQSPVERRPAPSAALADGARFVGRTNELDKLSERILAAVSIGTEPLVERKMEKGWAHNVLLLGEAGIGKSRILAELFRGIELSGLAHVAYGRCRELSSIVPYSALREALSEIPAWLNREKGERGGRLRHAIAGVLRANGGVLSGLAPELAEIAGAAPASDDLGPAGTRGVADALTGLIATISIEIPLIFALEDLQWADEATISVLEQIARSVVGMPSMLVFSGRTSLQDSAVSRIPSVDVIAIEPLSLADSRALVSAALGDADDLLVSDLFKLVPLFGAGNPLFDLQVLHQLGVDGFLRRNADGRVELLEKGGKAFSAPASLADVMKRSLAGLSSGTKAVLSVGALIGQKFAKGDLGAIELFSAQEIEAAVKEADLACLTSSNDELVSFAHESMRDGLIAQISAERQVQYHGLIARRVAENDGDPGVLAHHLERAGETLRAADAYFNAGSLAARLQDPMGASRLFRRTIDLLLQLLEESQSESERSFSIQERIARAAHELARGAGLLGNTGDILETLSRVAKSLPETRLTTAALSSALARVHYVRGEFVDAISNSRKALGAVGDDKALMPYQCLPSNIVGRALAAGGKFGPALAPLRKGCELAAAAHEHIELCHSRGILSVALSYAGHFDEAEANVASAEKLAEKLRDPARLLGTWFYYAVLAEARADYELGRSATAHLLSYAEEHGLSGLYLYTGTMFAGRHQFHVGQLKRARVLLSNAINLGRVLGIGMGAGWAQAFLGDVYFVEGRIDDALVCYEKAIEIGSTGAGDAYALSLGKAGKMHTLSITARDEKKVKALFAETLADLSASGNRSTTVVALDRYSDALMSLGDIENAANAANERDGLAAALGVKRAMFWPNTPSQSAAREGASAEGAGSTRDYWVTARTARHIAENVGDGRKVEAARVGAENTTENQRGQNASASAMEATSQHRAHAETVLSPVAAEAPRSAEPSEAKPTENRHHESGRREKMTLFETLAAVEGYVPKLEPKAEYITTPIRRRSA